LVEPRVGTMEDINEQAEWLSTIKVNQLSNRALTLASKLARNIRAESGYTVKLQDKEIAIRLAEQVTIIDKPELHQLYREFLEEAVLKQDNVAEKKEAPKEPRGYYRGAKVE